MVYLLLAPFLIEIAPIPARNQKLEWFQLWMNTSRPVKHVSIEWIFDVEPDARETVSMLP